ncbi:PREDICTED: uncharacterized protein LOC109206865 [Nicotiana attenuata]|uniref:RRM domain-containing protein n=1 Tax=Nicotiana attenuata TaxID=49451 RepID=A0A314KVG6_NICAT|nr:PREDICTED: uncharacterized protein LOC109206865 [Nicotiana attenuata]OIT32759.1 hypothetical protein A4A49_08355 [Nicotiana attenuata]
MAAKPFQITVEEFRLFHTIDRALYSLLVIELQRDPLESMQTLALWIWLERTRFNDIIRKILSLPQFLINELADEAVTCLKCIEDIQSLLSTDASEIPLTQSLMAKEFSLLFFHENRDSATSGIKKIVTEVCLKALTDIMEKALKRSSEQTLTESKVSMVAPLAESFLIERIAQLGLGSDASPKSTTGHDVPREERTMFVTFSKGYPVAEYEIREFFTRIFGDCIECIHMQEVKSNEQALYARIVFVTPAIIDFILNDVPKAKFTINGKHVWMRKFVPKNGNSSLAYMLPQNPPETI